MTLSPTQQQTLLTHLKKIKLTDMASAILAACSDRTADIAERAAEGETLNVCEQFIERIADAALYEDQVYGNVENFESIEDYAAQICDAEGLDKEGALNKLEKLIADGILCIAE